MEKTVDLPEGRPAPAFIIKKYYSLAGMTLERERAEQIEKAIRETLSELGVDAARVEAIDKGALDCTVKARTQAAAYRAAESTDYEWRTKA